MTDNNHPITPPPELIANWAGSMCGYYEAARWGADQELEACCEWLRGNDPYEHDYHQMLRAVRRPKPPSLKEQALAKLPEHPENMASHLKLTPGEVATIRRALEQLDD